MADFLGFAANGAPDAQAQAIDRALSAAATGAMRDVAADAKAPLRADLATLGKLANTWRVNVFPKYGVALDPAMQISNKEGALLDAFANGVTITAANSRFLAIPTPEALAIYRASMPSGSNGKFIAREPWPDMVADHFGGDPHTFVEPGGQRGFIYVQVGKTRKLIGWLERQAVLGKRIEGRAVLDRIAASLPLTYGSRFDDYLQAELKAIKL